MKIAVGGDHAGFPYKAEIISFLQAKGHETIDKGAFSTDSVDYPDFAHAVAQAVVSGEADAAILLCGSGNGVAITANKYADIRAALCWNVEITELARQHNNANALALPVRFVSLDTALAMVAAFVDTPFEGGRHATRVDKIKCK
jgi:ribose 5-phosphate isomerase B